MFIELLLHLKTEKSLGNNFPLSKCPKVTFKYPTVPVICGTIKVVCLYDYPILPFLNIHFFLVLSIFTQPLYHKLLIITICSKQDVSYSTLGFVLDVWCLMVCDFSFPFQIHKILMYSCAQYLRQCWRTILNSLHSPSGQVKWNIRWGFKKTFNIAFQFQQFKPLLSC